MNLFRLSIFFLSLFKESISARIGYYSDATCSTLTSTVTAYSDVCLPEAGQQVAVVLMACSSTSLTGSLFASLSMATAPVCAGSSQVFTATSVCTQIGTSSVYTRALDFTCSSGGNVFIYQLDLASRTCASTSSVSLVRYIPIVAGGVCNAGTSAALDVEATAVGSTVSLSFYTSTSGTCSGSSYVFSSVPTTGACTAVTGSATSSIKVWAATCSMRLFPGFDVVGTKISSSMVTTESLCSAACCSTSSCVAYSFAVAMADLSATTPSTAFTGITSLIDQGNGPIRASVTGTLSSLSAQFKGFPCVLLSNVTSFVPSNMWTGGIIPSFLSSG